MTSSDYASPVPGVRGPHLKITTASGFTYWLARSAVRYFITGKEIFGPGDNATWLHDATTDYRGKPYERLTRARWRRVARRWAILGFPASLAGADLLADGTRMIWGVFGADPPGLAEVPYGGLLDAYLIGAPVAVGAVVVPRARVWYREREPRREFVYPAAKVLCRITGTKFSRRDAVSMISLPPDFGSELEDGAAPPSVRVFLPPVPLDANTKKRIESNVGARLGMPGAAGTWHESGGRAFVDLLPAALPPSKLSLEDMKAAIEAAPIERPVAGMANGREPVHTDFDNDSPHVGVSGGSGSGKSTLLRLLLSQRMARGAGVVFLDFKRWSHDWAHGLPSDRALYFHRIPEIHEACVAIGEELIRRKELPTRAELDALRTLDVVVEEANSLIPMLREYWTEVRAAIKAENRRALKEDPFADVTEPPVQSPAILALSNLINMGRELHAHAHYAGQRLSATVFGPNGGDKRSSFQTRFLGKWDKAMWRMLASDVPYLVCPGGPRGIWCVIQGGTATIIRVPFVKPEEARALALSGPSPSQPILPSLPFSGQVIDGSRDSVREVPDRRVKLAEAVEHLPGERLTVEALRMARKQDPRFPAPVETGGPGRPDLFELRELITWKARRDGLPELG